MTAAVIPLRPASRPLNKEERLLVRSVVGLVERVAKQVCRELGGDPRDPDLLQRGHLGVYQAAQTYDPARLPFAQWAAYKAASAMMDGLRWDHRGSRLMVAARIAACVYLGTKEHRDEDDSANATDGVLFDELVGIADGQLVASLIGVAIEAERLTGEDAVVEREAWANTLSALDAELRALREDQRELLERYANGHDLKRMAKGRGVCYWTLLPEFHELIGMMRARLRFRGVKRMPTPVDGEWAPVIRPDPPDAG